MGKKIALGILLCFSLSLQLTFAWGYVDPGTGSLMAGSIWPFILSALGIAGGFLARYLVKPIKKGITQLWKNIKRESF